MMYSLSNWLRSSHGPDADPLGSCVLYIYPCVCGMNKFLLRADRVPVLPDELERLLFLRFFTCFSQPMLGEHRRWSQNGHKTGATLQS
jgi:hypothetical protein